MSIIGNFTFSRYWKEAIYLRYPESDILKLNSLLFAKVGAEYRCHHFFKFHLDLQDYNEILNQINNGIKLRFNYVDESLYNALKNWSEKEKKSLKIIDSWDSPKLKLNSSIEDHLLFNCGKQTTRNYKKYKKNSFNFQYLDSKNFSPEILWKDVLLIDVNSWKFRENSDMKSLNREDLQYQQFLINERENTFLNVLYQDNIPLAYSLFFRNSVTKQWYAVKWGASDLGRKYYAGLFCLYNHLEKLEKIEQRIDLDFWGRRNATYDLLKNYSEKRYHILISKEGEL